MAKDHPNAQYQFVAEGRLGPTGRLVREALDRAQEGDFSAITQLMNERALGPVEMEAMARAKVSVEETPYLKIIEIAEGQAGALLPNVSGAAEAEERGRWVVLELLNAVTDRSGRANPAERLITRDEVLAFLSTPRDRIPTTAWDEDMKAAFLASVLTNTEQLPVVLECRPDPSVAQLADGGGGNIESRLLEQWIDDRAVCLLGGASGTGKSTALALMQRRAAEAGRIAIVADAEEYIPGRLAALVSNALNAHSYIGAYPRLATLL